MKGTIQFIQHKIDKPWKDTVIHEYDIQVGNDIGVISYFGDQKPDNTGDTIEYEVKKDEYGTKIRKPKKEAAAGGYQKSNAYDPKTMLMSYAKDIGVALIRASGMEDFNIESVIKDYYKLCDAYYNPASFTANKKPSELPTNDSPPMPVAAEDEHPPF